MALYSQHKTIRAQTFISLLSLESRNSVLTFELVLGKDYVY